MEGIGRGGRKTYLIQRESWIAWDGEVIVESYVLDFLLRFSVSTHTSAYIPEPLLQSNQIHNPSINPPTPSNCPYTQQNIN
jgi:hypothetical protein